MEKYKFLAVVLAMLGIFIFLMGGLPDFRHPEEDLEIAGFTDQPGVVVDRVIWHEVGGLLDNNRWISFIGYLSNQSPEAVRIVSSKIRVFREDGTSWTSVTNQFGNNFVVIRPGEGGSFWAAGLRFPSWPISLKVWSRIEIHLEVLPYEEGMSCRNTFGDFEFTEIAGGKEGELAIQGKVDPSQEYLYETRATLSFFDENGDFVGRGVSYIDHETGEFTGRFSETIRPLSNTTTHELLHGYFINGEIASYRVDAIESRGGRCE